MLTRGPIDMTENKVEPFAGHRGLYYLSFVVSTLPALENDGSLLAGAGGRQRKQHPTRRLPVARPTGLSEYGYFAGTSAELR